MNAAAKSALLIVVLCCISRAQSTSQPDDLGPASYDLLDPRLDSHLEALKYRLQVRLGRYPSPADSLPDIRNIGGLDRSIDSYLQRAVPYRFHYQTPDLRLYARLRLKEDWLGMVESDSGISNLQSSVTFAGKGIIRDKVELYESITFFRADTTSYLDNASTTGEFLKDPLLSYQLPGRGPIASDVDVFDIQVDRAFIRTEILGVGIGLGRDRIQLKTGYRTGLLFSGITRPIDLFYDITYTFWRFDFRSFSGQLVDAGTRYISVKSLSFELAHNLRINATEGVAFFDDPLAYINPIMPFFVTHRHRPTNQDNLIATADISYTPVKNLNVYAAFLDDDLIIFEGGASKYGFTFGLFKPQLLSERLDLRAEYTQVRKWTYTHVSHVNAWEYRNQPFGFWLGPDADEFYAELKCLLTPATYVTATFDRVRRGEGTLFLPFEEEGGDETPLFPSGVVERSTGAWIDLRHELGSLTIRGRLGYRWMENRRNQAGDDGGNSFAHWVVSYTL